MKWRMMAGGLACVATMAHAEPEPKMIGNWMVSSESDKFSGGNIHTAITTDRAMALSVRCNAKKLNVTLIPAGPGANTRAAGDQFRVRVRIEGLPDFDTAGRALDTQIVQIDADKRLVKAIRDAREVVIRLAAPMGVTEMLAYNTTGAPKAFAELAKECPLD